MDVKSFQIQVAAGTVTFRTLRASQTLVEVDTPSVAVRPLRPGAYRVTVVRTARLKLASVPVKPKSTARAAENTWQAGQTMEARGPASDAEFQVVQPARPDAFDRWNDERDRYIENSQSYRHVSPDISGAEDLDQNGQWVNDPTMVRFGSPRGSGLGAVSKRPLGLGRLLWLDLGERRSLGLGAVSLRPLVLGRGRMGLVSRPVWASLLGARLCRILWLRRRLGVGVGFGFGGVGWVALAPFELFHPWWGRGFYGGFRGGVFGNHTTIVNNANVFNSYRNARVSGGAIGVNAPGSDAADSLRRSIGPNFSRPGLVHGALPVAPDRSSLRLSDRAVSGRFPQARSQSFASRMQAPSVGMPASSSSSAECSRCRVGISTRRRQGTGCRPRL